ncbi:hypothetical protein A0H81_03296 [Grifola frondosa]|uniref:Uncharacterized protein n=1 Tax=Grifola frondosa TaxID=5627 RepID=A0A1C7MGH1_GRIFR|nr:hypothetical protein A0H81_03296 [Grifola frondosa]
MHPVAEVEQNHVDQETADRAVADTLELYSEQPLSSDVGISSPLPSSSSQMSRETPAQASTSMRLKSQTMQTDFSAIKNSNTRTETVPKKSMRTFSQHKEKLKGPEWVVARQAFQAMVDDSRYDPEAARLYSDQTVVSSANIQSSQTRQGIDDENSVEDRAAGKYYAVDYSGCRRDPESPLCDIKDFQLHLLHLSDLESSQGIGPGCQLQTSVR